MTAWDWLTLGFALVFVVACPWLNAKIVERQCRRGIHDWEAGYGPCMDCGKRPPWLRPRRQR